MTGVVTAVVVLAGLPLANVAAIAMVLAGRPPRDSP